MNKTLEYQKLDMELNKLKRSTLNSEDKTNMMKLKGYIVDTHNKGMQLEKDGKALLNDYSNLKANYEKNYEKVQNLINTKIEKVELADVDGVLSTINSLSSELFLLERNINIIISKIKSSLKDFETTKNNIIKAKRRYSEVKVNYEQQVKNISPKLKEIEDKMKNMEKELKPELLRQYKTIKSDKIFPVFVSFKDGNCSGCRVELPTAKVNKLKNDGTIVCEQCHRIIYFL